MASGAEDQILRSFNALRKAIGYLGMGLPFIVAIGAAALHSDPIQETVSHYAGTVMRDVFVGILCVVAVFFFFYLGYKKADYDPRFWPSDNVISNVTGFFALLVALFPITHEAEWVKVVHRVGAVGMFSVLAIMSYFVFTKTDPAGTPSRQKLIRNRWYRAFGIVIVVCMILILVYSLLPVPRPIAGIQPIFWLEAAALLAFGAAWAMKGEARWASPDPS